MLPCTRARKKTVLILCDKICEEQAFPHLLSTSNFGYNTPQDIEICPARYSIILDDPYDPYDHKYLSLFLGPYLPLKITNEL